MIGLMYLAGQPDAPPMTEKQIKRFLEDRGLRISDVARELNLEFPSVTVRSADVMLRQLIYGHRWYPAYVVWLKNKYGVTVGKPSWLKSVRERTSSAA